MLPMLLVVKFSAAAEVSALSSVESRETVDLVMLPDVLWCCLAKWSVVTLYNLCLYYLSS